MSTHLVLGGTGKTGRRLTRLLSSAGHTVRAAARTPAPASPGSSSGPGPCSATTRSSGTAAAPGAPSRS